MKWTDKDEQELIKHYPDKSLDSLSEMFGRKPSTIKTKAQKLGLKKSYRYTPDEEELLKSLWDFYSVTQIAEKLGKSVSSVRDKSKNLGLAKKKRIATKIYRAIYDKPNNKNVPIVEPIKGTVSLRDIQPKQCRYVTDEGVDMMLCGAPVMDGQGYCKPCCDVVYSEFGKKRDVNVKPIGRTRLNKGNFWGSRKKLTLMTQ